MRIVLDGSPLGVATGGIRRYTEQLAEALAALQPDDEIFLVSDQPLARPPVTELSNVSVEDTTPTGWQKRWWSIGVASACRRLRASVFHGTDYAVPYLHRYPAVVTIHDLSPWRFPAWQPGAKRIRRRTPWLLRLGRADIVITVSAAIRKELIARFALPPERVVTIPLAAAGYFSPRKGEAMPPGLANHQQAAQLQKQPFLLFAGTLEPRKNLNVLLNAWQQTDTHAATLCLVGRLREDGQRPPESPNILWLGEQDDDSLRWLYSHATAFAYPSHYEGFGLPVLEAMQCGAPVLVGDCPALRELVGPAGMLVPPVDLDGWSSAIHRALNDSVWCEALAQQGKQRAADFSWKRTACETRRVYKEAIARFAH
jgi:glycosyltransferase involved in cell wall biosynthesis